MARLENWSITGRDPYLAPELQEACLYGTVYGHLRLKDGNTVVTSSIVKSEGEIIITHSGSQYELGKVDPEYEKEFPNARERLFESLRRKNENQG